MYELFDSRSSVMCLLFLFFYFAFSLLLLKQGGALHLLYINLVNYTFFDQHSKAYFIFVMPWFPHSYSGKHTWYGEGFGLWILTCRFFFSYLQYTCYLLSKKFQNLYKIHWFSGIIWIFIIKKILEYFSWRKRCIIGGESCHGSQKKNIYIYIKKMKMEVKLVTVVKAFDVQLLS
jgi:hypothetical protein